MEGRFMAPPGAEGHNGWLYRSQRETRMWGGNWEPWQQQGKQLCDLPSTTAPKGQILAMEAIGGECKPCFSLQRVPLYK